VETQLDSEKAAHEAPQKIEELRATMAQPDFVFETREHIAFCFACLGRTLPPEEQAALLLREVLGFTAHEAAGILTISEPIFRHRLSAARKAMTESFAGLCQLINKSGPCWQCQGLRELAPEKNRGEELVQIQVAPGVAVTPENLLEARLEIVRQQFFANLTRREEGAG
jgi:RNA polymerase sigma-70 factor (ECF subfamily)